MDTFSIIRQILQQNNSLSYEQQGILTAQVADAATGIALAKSLLTTIVDRKTALYLSGGSTPKSLYEQLAKDEQIHPGVVGLIDERFGDPYHAESNEKMVLQTGLIRYLSLRDIQYYSILRGLPVAESAIRYDDLVRSMQAVYPKNIGILGIGSDGHLASIAPNRADFTNPLFDKKNSLAMVSYFDDAQGKFKKRITMTFLGLKMLDVLIVLVFGKEKSDALQKMFIEGEIEDIPSRFYKQPDIAKKTILITDISFSQT